MPFNYPILCLEPHCGRPATHKIAARWSDGQTHELKTYGLVCERCLPAKLEASRAKNAACGRAEGEILDPPSVFRLDTGAMVEPLPAAKLSSRPSRLPFLVVKESVTTKEGRREGREEDGPTSSRHRR